jgi:hypothetical protein
LYATVKRYELGAGSRGVGAITEIMRRCQEELLPQVKENGFAGFYVLDTGDGIIASVSLFEQEAGAEEGNELTKRFFKEKLSGLLQANPQVTQGQAVIHQP